MIKELWLSGLAVLVCGALFAQDSSRHAQPAPSQAFVQAAIADHDSTYYHAYPRFITGRVYLSQKYGSFSIRGGNTKTNISYMPNTNLNLGVGITYHSVSLNLGYGFGFLNNDPDKGKTQYVDLQSHVYTRKWAFDLFGQFYKGAYIPSRGLVPSWTDAYYVRPDVGGMLIGLSAYRLLNSKKFSYRAALWQSEKQEKSAGTVLLGAELYYGRNKGDSSVIPTELWASDQPGLLSTSFFRIGPGVGYAYTLVLGKYFFLTGSLTANLSLNYDQDKNAIADPDKVSISKGFIYRLATGYDRNNWIVNLTWVGNTLTVPGTLHEKYYFSNGNIRLTLARRFRPGKKLSKKLQPVEKVILDVKGKG